MFTAKDQENNTNPLDMPEINAEKIDRQNKKLQERGSTDLTRKLCQKLSEDVYADTGIPLAVSIEHRTCLCYRDSTGRCLIDCRHSFATDRFGSNRIIATATMGLYSVK